MKKIYFAYASLLLFSLLFYGFSGDDLRYPGGAPAAYTGSPADGRNCTHCHGGTASTVENWISTNIPELGYAPGETYEITVTATGSGKKGFELAPQNEAGDLLGTLIAGSGSRLVGDDQYITQSNSINSNPAVWTFQWTAPEEGTGDVVFYGAIAIKESQTKLTSLQVIEDLTTSIAEDEITQLRVYPNPVKDQLFVNYQLQQTEKVSIQLYNLNGSLVSSLLDETQMAGQHNFRSSPKGMTRGIYLLVYKAGNKQLVQKVLFN